MSRVNLRLLLVFNRLSTNRNPLVAFNVPIMRQSIGLFTYLPRTQAFVEKLVNVFILIIIKITCF